MSVTATFGKPKKKQEPVEIPRVELQNTTRNTLPRGEPVKHVEVEHATIVYPDGSIEAKLRGKPDKTMTIGEVTDDGLNPVIRGWYNLANSGAELQHVTIDNKPVQVDRHGYESVDVQVSDVQIVNRREVKDPASWAYAVDTGEKRVVRVG